jgi:hypothetical protein
VKIIDRIPVRHVAAILAASACAYLCSISHYKAIAQQDPHSIWLGAPPPPVEAFIETFLAAPGFLAGLPFIVAGSLGDLAWLVSVGVAFGAGFFWYCVGWYIDCSYTALPMQPPKVIGGYMRALGLVSAILFPLGILAGFSSGNGCAIGRPPGWAVLLEYGILMFWISLGAFFSWRRFQARRATHRTSHTPIMP